MSHQGLKTANIKGPLILLDPQSWNFMGPHQLLRAIGPRACLVSDPWWDNNVPYLITIWNTLQFLQYRWLDELVLVETSVYNGQAYNWVNHVMHVRKCFMHSVMTSKIYAEFIKVA